MNAAGLALFLYAATIIVSQTHQAALTAPPTAIAATQTVTSPDHAPPHPLTPRVPPVERPPDTLLRAVLEVAKAALQSHGH